MPLGGWVTLARPVAPNENGCKVERLVRAIRSLFKRNRSCQRLEHVFDYVPVDESAAEAVEIV
jgi:hypothetical protein